MRRTRILTTLAIAGLAGGLFGMAAPARAECASTVEGTPGVRDVFRSTPADECFIGNPGDHDVVSYRTATGGVTVNLFDGTASGDGTDELTDVEDVVGSEFDDVITGSPVANRLEGRQGNDRIMAGPGDDTVYGDEGDDLVFGGLGNDRIVGGSENDRLRGENGNDQIDGNEGNDDLLGGAGDDILRSGLGNDQSVRGSGGNDSIGIYPGSRSRIDGGPGSDHIGFLGWSGGVTLNLCTGAGSGDGFTFNVVREALCDSTFESIAMTPNADTVTGDSSSEYITMGDGDDTFTSGTGVGVTVKLGPGDDVANLQQGTVDVMCGPSPDTINEGGNGANITNSDGSCTAAP